VQSLKKSVAHIHDDPNKGIPVVIWVTALTVVILFIIAGILWWWDGYILH